MSLTKFRQPGTSHQLASVVPLLSDPSHHFGQPPPQKKIRPEMQQNHILLVTVLNPVYPITTQVLHTIAAPFGEVIRIVIFRKNGVQAMIEFDSVETASKAKEGLDGADIYAGCCTLRIEYAKPSKLNVYKNDNDSWEYTNPDLNSSRGPVGKNGEINIPMPPRKVLLSEPPHGFGFQPPKPVFPAPAEFNGDGKCSNPTRPPQNILCHGSGFCNHYDVYGGPDRRVGFDENFSSPTALRASATGSVNQPGQVNSLAVGQVSPSSVAVVNPAVLQNRVGGCVMMVYGLNTAKMNCDKLFNLFCLYGNVIRVKYLKSKEGTAMVQMGDGVSVERAIHNVHNSIIFGSKLQLSYSKQAFLANVQQPYELPDGSPSFKDYTGSRNNRFMNAEQASKNRIQPPTRMLHFFNTPPGLNEEQLLKGFGDSAVSEPCTVKFFESKSERSSSGLLEFKDVEEALNALVSVNHAAIPHSGGKFPYIMKLCFSTFKKRDGF